MKFLVWSDTSLHNPPGTTTEVKVEEHWEGIHPDSLAKLGEQGVIEAYFGRHSLNSGRIINPRIVNGVLHWEQHSTMHYVEVESLEALVAIVKSSLADSIELSMNGKEPAIRFNSRWD